MRGRRPPHLPQGDPPRGEAQRRARAAASAPQAVRLIGGRFKRTPLPVADWPGLRPTPARVRETLFNWLGQDLTGWRVLDAFAGSGALGLEAASRGAAEVVMLEREVVLARHIAGIAQRLGAPGVAVHTADALAWMQRTAQGQPGGRFDLILLDPPFDAAELFHPALEAARRCLPTGGWIYLESPRPYREAIVTDSPAPGADASAKQSHAQGGAAALPPGLALRREGRAGVVHYHLIERVDSATGPDPVAT